VINIRLKQVKVARWQGNFGGRAKARYYEKSNVQVPAFIEKIPRISAVWRMGT
jgi:hypothetical protein